MTIKTDSECLPLCKAVDKINGLRVLEASCGNGERPFTLWFAVEEDLKPLMQFLNILDSTNWRSFCAMSPATFYIQSSSKGPAAYREANELAERIIKTL
jgi:hypothetical protein